MYGPITRESFELHITFSLRFPSPPFKLVPFLPGYQRLLGSRGGGRVKVPPAADEGARTEREVTT